METQEKINITVRIFSFLVRKTIDKSFVFPGGGAARRTMTAFIASMEDTGRQEFSVGRITDYCICQVHALSMYDAALFSRWTAAHSFGQRAVERFAGNTRAKRYFEDQFLREFALSREWLSDEFRDRSLHPLMKFVYPEYEEITKRRLHNTEAGFYICQVSTLLWTPFSNACRSCKNNMRCRSVTMWKHPELYRIRILESAKANPL